MISIKKDYKSILSNYKEFEDTVREIMTELNVMNDLPLSSSPSLAKYYTSEEYLNKLIAERGDLSFAEYRCMERFDQYKYNKRLARFLLELFPGHSIFPSGHFYYPKQHGFMSWHTNSETPFKHVYITFTEEAGKSFFAYKDGDSIVRDYDDVGITVREFDLAEQFWHCVYSETNRYSFGFSIRKITK